MGNNTFGKIKYDLKVIFYGNIPREVKRNIENNTEMRLINNDYYFFEKYKWYLYLRLNNHEIINVNDIQFIIKNKLPSTVNPPKFFKKNVIICFVSTLDAINLIQHYQKEFFKNNNIEDDTPYFIFNKRNLNRIIPNHWNIKILIDEDREIINIMGVNHLLQIYQTDFFYEDFMKCRIFRSYNDLREIYERLNQIIERNEYILNINDNTEKLEITFNINDRPDNDELLSNSNNAINESISTDGSNEDIEKIDSKKYLIFKQKIKRTQKNNVKIIADDYDAILIVEQNIFMHISIIDLEANERAIFNSLLDAADYYNYLPLLIDEDKTSYNSFNVMSVGKTQSGKSVLMNKMAGKNITNSNQGTLRTEDIFMRDICNGIINLYDTCGASNYFLPKDIYLRLKNKIELLNNNGEKIDLLLIVIKKGDIPDKYIFQDLIIKLIQLNLNYLIVINYHERAINSIRRIVIESFLENGCQIDDSNIVDVNILRDITPLYQKIFEKFKNSRITSLTFQNQNLSNINNLATYSQNHHLLLYRDISFDNIVKRKNWEAEKLFTKYLILMIGSNFVPLANLILPFIQTLKLISGLHNIYLGYPLFNEYFFNLWNNIKSLDKEKIKRFLSDLSVKTGFKFFIKLGVGLGIKTVIKISGTILVIFPLVGLLIEGIIGNIIDIPSYKKDYEEAKAEFLNTIKSRPNDTLKKIVNDYNDAINYFGKRGDSNINKNDYIIPIEERNNLNLDDEIIQLFNLNE